MNKGNSGGPVVLLADDPARDVVIGIANFNLNPFAQRDEELAGVAAAFPCHVVIMGVDFKKFSTLIGAALSSQSHGVVVASPSIVYNCRNPDHYLTCAEPDGPGLAAS